MSETKKIKAQIGLEQFLLLDIRIGTIVAAAVNEKAREPAYVLDVDFGSMGRRTSSAQLTQNYSVRDLIGKQIVAVVNFPAKRIAGIKSEVLILGAMSERDGVVLLEPASMVENGVPIG